MNWEFWSRVLPTVVSGLILAGIIALAKAIKNPVGALAKRAISNRDRNLSVSFCFCDLLIISSVVLSVHHIQHPPFRYAVLLSCCNIGFAFVAKVLLICFYAYYQRLRIRLAQAQSATPVIEVSPLSGMLIYLVANTGAIFVYVAYKLVIARLYGA